MNKTLRLTLTAMLCALSVAANFLTIPVMPNKVVSFAPLFAFIAGMYLGTLPAVAVGFLGDLIAHFIHPYGAYNYFIGLSCMLMGLVPALVYKLKMNKIAKLVVSLLTFFVVGSAFLNTFGLWLQYIVGVEASPVGLWQFFTMDKSGIKKSFWLYLAGRLPIQAINLVANGIVLAILQQTKAIDRLLCSITTRKDEKIKQNQDENCTENVDKSEKIVDCENKSLDINEKTTKDNKTENENF